MSRNVGGDGDLGETERNGAVGVREKVCDAGWDSHHITFRYLKGFIFRIRHKTNHSLP